MPTSAEIAALSHALSNWGKAIGSAFDPIIEAQRERERQEAAIRLALERENLRSKNQTARDLLEILSRSNTPPSGYRAIAEALESSGATNLAQIARQMGMLAEESERQSIKLLGDTYSALLDANPQLTPEAKDSIKQQIFNIIQGVDSGSLTPEAVKPIFEAIGKSMRTPSTQINIGSPSELARLMELEPEKQSLAAKYLSTMQGRKPAADILEQSAQISKEQTRQTQLAKIEAIRSVVNSLPADNPDKAAQKAEMLDALSKLEGRVNEGNDVSSAIDAFDRHVRTLTRGPLAQVTIGGGDKGQEAYRKTLGTQIAKTQMEDIEGIKQSARIAEQFLVLTNGIDKDSKLLSGKIANFTTALAPILNSIDQIWPGFKDAAANLVGSAELASIDNTAAIDTANLLNTLASIKNFGLSPVSNVDVDLTNRAMGSDAATPEKRKVILFLFRGAARKMLKANEYAAKSQQAAVSGDYEESQRYYNEILKLNSIPTLSPSFLSKDEWDFVRKVNKNEKLLVGPPGSEYEYVLKSHVDKLAESPNTRSLALAITVYDYLLNNPPSPGRFDDTLKQISERSGVEKEQILEALMQEVSKGVKINVQDESQIEKALEDFAADLQKKIGIPKETALQYLRRHHGRVGS